MAIRRFAMMKTVGVFGANLRRSAGEIKMEKIAIIAVIILMIVNAAKKTGVFGQMTLTNSRALDWLKDKMKIEIEKIEMGDASAFSEDYNLPEWAGGWIAIIKPASDWMNPVLVTQNTALQWIEGMCVEWEDGAHTVSKGIKRNKMPVAQIVFKKDKPIVEFVRKDKTKFAPYECKIHESKS